MFVIAMIFLAMILTRNSVSMKKYLKNQFSVIDARVIFIFPICCRVILTRLWKDHLKNDLRSDQDHRQKIDLRSRSRFFKNDLRSRSRS
jgi:hypothetical protein